MKTVGIIGFGSFGAFLAAKLDEFATVKVFSYSGKPNQWAVSIEEVAQTDYLILSIPVETYRSVLRQIKPLLKPNTVIVDVCSVKVEPSKIIKSVLPNQPLVMTHPLFGPESAANSLVGHTMVLCADQSTEGPYEEVREFSERLELKIVEMTCDEHDREIAIVQGLAFFVARALTRFGIHGQQISTPSFERLLHLADLDKHHSDDLFETIQNGNQYAAEVRNSFVASLNAVGSEIDSD